MAELRTEEEQLEALKRWWHEYGKSLLLGVAVALVLFFGWQTWQKREANQAANASALYQNLIQSVVMQLDEGSARDLTGLQQMADLLKADHAKSTYAGYAALLMARVKAEEGDYAAALTELDWVLSAKLELDLHRVAQLRKARVLMQLQRQDEALILLTQFDAGAFEAQYQEVLGDLYLQLGDEAQALTAYERALAIPAATERPILQMKRDNLGEAS
ncbi:YfgM family protein [Nitrincola tapanii]|uniref:Ancillary SecYEG translocon subunit n=1 Tax=Nitrincola tapanii TaxID=1708751 RepID=A0A5A9W9B7_9GAMM|nr:tetratricopeptide repeat protein [Nitrincola tapanii]KAA0876639.1 tetratricopeptide repeat protein [Nitrincola tapanii]